MTNKNIKGLLLALAITTTLMFFSSEVVAQCPMCKMAAESNLKNGGDAGKGLNSGILYLLATPYLLIGGLGYFWWRNNQRRKAEEVEDELV